MAVVNCDGCGEWAHTYCVHGSNRVSLMAVTRVSGSFLHSMFFIINNLNEYQLQLVLYFHVIQNPHIFVIQFLSLTFVIHNHHIFVAHLFL